VFNDRARIDLTLEFEMELKLVHYKNKKSITYTAEPRKLENIDYNRVARNPHDPKI
jgi:hypothetical protein